MTRQVEVPHSTTRWWEFYAVRYFIGTVVGAVVFFLLCTTNPVLGHLLFGAKNGVISGPLLILFGAYGLTYCYIASAPVLVLHAGRFMLEIQSGFKKSLIGVAIWLLPPLVAGLLFYCVEPCVIPTSRVFYTFVFVLASLVIWPQYVLVVVALFRSKYLFWFYRRLSSKRSIANPSLVESYRHLREHGNSFFIVVLEVILAIVLYVVGNFSVRSSGATPTSDAYVLPYLWVLLIWIVPAALVWLIGTLIERQLCDG